MNNAAKTKTLTTLSNQCASAIARITSCGDTYHAKAIDAEVEMSVILENSPKLAKEWAEVLSAHRNEIDSWN